MEELIQTIKFLEIDQLKEINDYIDTLELFQSKVFDHSGEGDGNKQDISVRSSISTPLKELNDVTKTIHESMNAALLVYKDRISELCPTFKQYPVPGGYSTTSFRESIQVLQYTEDQEYLFHTDQSPDKRAFEFDRKISIVLYLTGGFEGGGTEFPHATFKPKPGYGLIFPSNWCYPHSGQKVTKGCKRVAVTWYYVDRELIVTKDESVKG